MYGDFMPIFATLYFSSAIALLIASFRSPFLQNLYLHGKHRKSSLNANTSPRFLVSKNCFIQFYLLGLLVNSGLLYMVSLVHLIFTTLQQEWPNLKVQRLLFQAHLIRRSLEQLIMFGNLPKESHMHVAAYLFGLSYYVVVPLCLSGGYMATPFLIINIASQIFQSYSHYKLSVLRRSHVYKLPKEWPFNHILCPHYLAECIVYMSISCNARMVLCTIFVTLEMLVLGHSNKRWYQTNFPGLHAKYALIPHVF